MCGTYDGPRRSKIGPIMTANILSRMFDKLGLQVDIAAGSVGAYDERVAARHGGTEEQNDQAFYSRFWALGN